MINKKIKDFVKNKNKQKIIFTAGPGSLTKENIMGLAPCFGRGDNLYKKTENKVLSKLKKISGHKNIVSMQGSGSLALEIVALNFLFGKVLIVSTGYYSDRLFDLSLKAKKTNKYIKYIKKINWQSINKIKEKFDWVWACPTETSRGLKLPIKDLKKLAKKARAKLALDATASFGLENNHNLSDVTSFSSCKGLFGLTGASFICYNNQPKNKINLFYLDLNSHKNKKMTGPYHAIQSLEFILKDYNKFKKSVVMNKKKITKKFKNFLVYEKKNQPLLCTYLSCKIKPKLSKVILYKPRINLSGSVICHLGEAHLKGKSKGKIIDYLDIDD
ncbi:MAG: hypothetical protein CMI71_00905 [Candidatus Pelagibacter sp.]|nr:hypothetical protein [Candidatus Pelagibacter sp.]RPG12078.1 MAG: aminotransferase class V-fold PLP-dependent enzyme [Pelagibacteraceae bacterium TMED170]